MIPKQQAKHNKISLVGKTTLFKACGIRAVKRKCTLAPANILCLLHYPEQRQPFTLQLRKTNMGQIYLSKVAELRKLKNLTQHQLAVKVGVDTSTIRNWERDRDGTKTFVKIAKLCEVLNCSPSDLFAVEDILGYGKE